MADQAAKTRGFTLVEMLVVVFVIAILVTIVVGVSKIVHNRAGKEQTRATMQVVGAALEAYYQATGDYPADPDPKTFPAQPSVGWTVRDWQAFCRATLLYAQLWGLAQSRAKLGPLGEDAVQRVNANNVLVDGFGKCLDYFRDRGAGGTPLLLSAGGDGNYDSQEDNIRSDDR